MNYLKDNPTGIDSKLQRVQEYLYNKLISSWGVNIDGYGRVYIDDSKDSIIPKAYIGNGEYKSMLLNDNVKGAYFFFIEGDESEVEYNTSLSSNNVDLIVVIDDLTKIKNDITHYADEEIKDEVKSYLKGLNLTVESVIKGKKAFEGFDVSNKSFKYPYFAFKIKTKINNY